jgi:hypothetical protein
VVRLQERRPSAVLIARRHKAGTERERERERERVKAFIYLARSVFRHTQGRKKDADLAMPMNVVRVYSTEA